MSKLLKTTLATVFLCLAAFCPAGAAGFSSLDLLDKDPGYDILGYEMDIFQKSDSLEIKSVTRFKMNDAGATSAVFFLSASCKIGKLDLDGETADYKQKKDSLNRALSVNILPDRGGVPAVHELKTEYSCRTHPFFSGKSMENSSDNEAYFMIRKDGVIVNTGDIHPVPGNSHDTKFSLIMKIHPAPDFLPYYPFTEQAGGPENPEFIVRRDQESHPQIKIELVQGYRMKSLQSGNMTITGLVKKDTLEEADLDNYLHDAAFVISTLTSMLGPLDDDRVFVVENINDSYDGDFADEIYYPVIYIVKFQLIGNKSIGNYLFGFSHEITHWWFPQLFSDYEPGSLWVVMSEGTASYMEHMLYESGPFGNNRVERLLNREQGYLESVRSFAPGEERPLTDFGDDPKSMRYWKGFMTLHGLRYIVGDQVFRNILHSLVSEYRGKIFTLDDFRAICERESGLELFWYVDTMLNTVKHLDVGIKSVEIVQEGDEKRLNITFENLGDFIFESPIDVRILYDNGEFVVLREKMNEKETVFTMYLQNDEVPRTIEVDPFLWIPDVNRKNNVYFMN